jgi:DNA-binding transcriptional ArsR family regulator
VRRATPEEARGAESLSHPPAALALRSSAAAVSPRQQRVDLDAVFAALAHPTRRAILSRLAAGEASVNEIAAPFEISQPAVSKHLKVLERAGLIERDVDKQRRPARLKAEPMAAAVRWLEEFKQFWSSSFDRLDGLLEELKEAETKGAENA